MAMTTCAGEQKAEFSGQESHLEPPGFQASSLTFLQLTAFTCKALLVVSTS